MKKEDRNLSNSECVIRMGKLVEFSNRQSSIYAHNNGKTYTVFSYGEHYPMYVYDLETERWYGNETKSTRTTGKHKSLVRPPIVEAWYPTEAMLLLSQYGLARTVERRMLA